MFEAAHARLDNLIDRTLDELVKCRAAGGTDTDYQSALIEQFKAAAALREPEAGAAHMALALYRLAVNQQLIAQMDAENARYAATLRDLEELEGL